MSDYMIRGTAAEGTVRFFAASTRDTVEKARVAHQLSPIATAALGRLLTGGAMMGYILKEDSDRITLKIDCQGPIGGLLVTADSRGHVKGYVKNPNVDLPSKIPGKLNVGDALDLGILSVIKDIGLGTPYVGETILQSGEIAEDLTYYFASSEQTPSSVALGVLLNEAGEVTTSGGFIFQVMPNAKEETIKTLEEKLGAFTSVTEHLNKGESIEDIVTALLESLSPSILAQESVRFACDCSQEKTKTMLASLPKEDLDEMIREGKDIEVVCHFCNKKYILSPEELEALRSEM